MFDMLGRSLVWSHLGPKGSDGGHRKGGRPHAKRQCAAVAQRGNAFLLTGLFKAWPKCSGWMTRQM